MSEPVVDAEVMDDAPEQSAAVIPMVPPAQTLAVTPQVEAAELKQRLDVIREAQTKAMVRDTDYGVIPGTNKPTLLKPGAEKLSVLFQLDVQLENEKEWGPGDHLTVVSKATVYHAPTGSRLGYGEGVCTSREKKYAKRKQDRECPECGEHAVLKSKKPGEGFFCWKKKGGCGANFPAADERITSQPEGEIENPDLPDTWNTVVKMAEKRARVDAVLAVTGASALFTQDVEDSAPAPEPVVELANGNQVDVLTQAVNFLLPEDRAVLLWDRIKEICGGDITSQAALVAIAVIQAKRRAEGTAPAAPGGSVEDTYPADRDGLDLDRPADINSEVSD